MPLVIVAVIYCRNEIPQAANRVVGILGLGLRAADRVVGAELFVRSISDNS